MATLDNSENWIVFFVKENDSKITLKHLKNCQAIGPESPPLTQKEHEALSYGLDHHIPTNSNRNNIKTEYQSFFQNQLCDISDQPENEISKVREKLCNVDEKYCYVKIKHILFL